ncbi:MAG: 4Fe-4S binding protein [Bacillota bacterium]|nr:4Fe-4S binding protein [Bacillota bacterium]
MKKTGPGRITFRAIKNLFKKPATTSYAGKGKPCVEKKYRGRICYDKTDCINCGLCMRDCPTGALKIINEGTKEDKKLKAVLNVGHCIFCCQCVDSCMKKCLTYSQDIDFATTNKADLTVEL